MLKIKSFSETSKANLQKKKRDKKLIKNWGPISLLNINIKLVSKVLAERPKNVLP